MSPPISPNLPQHPQKPYPVAYTFFGHLCTVTENIKDLLSLSVNRTCFIWAQSTQHRKIKTTRKKENTNNTL